MLDACVELNGNKYPAHAHPKGPHTSFALDSKHGKEDCHLKLYPKHIASYKFGIGIGIGIDIGIGFGMGICIGNGIGIVLCCLWGYRFLEAPGGFWESSGRPQSLWEAPADSTTLWTPKTTDLHNKNINMYKMCRKHICVFLHVTYQNHAVAQFVPKVMTLQCVFEGRVSKSRF